MGVFTFGSSGFKANNFQPVDCPTLMNEVYAAYINSGYDKDEAFQAAIWAYEGCAGNGGNESIIQG